MARFAIFVAVLVTIPALVLRVSGTHPGPGTEAIIYGGAILGAAFLLTWASEVAELDVAQGLAIAALALIAVLPEYAVDLYFAWKAAHHPEYTAYATANMTGANRLLIGIAWPLIVVLNWWKRGERELELPPSRQTELAFLAVATVYSFVIPVKGTLSAVDSIFLVGCFVLYLSRIAGTADHAPELVGPAREIARLPPTLRRLAVVALFLYAAAGILASAEPFAEALIATGHRLGIDEFLLVQWLAPLASEAPEVAVACILTLKGNPDAGMGAMISSKVNQWTLLVGTLPLVYSISAGALSVMHLDARQVEEILLTAAQSAFAVAVLANMRLSLGEAAALFVLFTAQLFFPDPRIRYGFSAAYLALTVVMIARRRAVLPRALRAGLLGR